MHSGVSRVSIGSAAQLSSYDNVKKFVVNKTSLNNDDFATRVVSSFISGFCVLTAMNPLDVVAIRLYNQMFTVRLKCIDKYVG